MEIKTTTYIFTYGKLSVIKSSLTMINEDVMIQELSDIATRDIKWDSHFTKELGSFFNSKIQIYNTNQQFPLVSAQEKETYLDLQMIFIIL